MFSSFGCLLRHSFHRHFKEGIQEARSLTAFDPHSRAEGSIYLLARVLSTGRKPCSLESTQTGMQRLASLTVPIGRCKYY